MPRSPDGVLVTIYRYYYFYYYCGCCYFC